MNFTFPPIVNLGQILTANLIERQLQVTQLSVSVPGMPAALDGFLIAQLSDLHAGQGGWRPIHLDRAIAVIGDFHPDALVNTGDFMYRNPPIEDVDAVMSRFQSLDVPHLAILGNHDYYGGDEPARLLARHLEAQHVEVIANRARSVRRGTDTVTFAGLTVHEPPYELTRGLLEISRGPRPRIALIHEPDLAEQIPPGSADLILAGHTHGGQVSLPFLRSRIVRKFCGSAYPQGPYWINGQPVYVNRGLGNTGVPARFRATPELTLIRLRSRAYCIDPPGKQPLY